jgi:cyclopropane fatty-acyl-phospholipid synthase-like methyltransferase
MMQLYHDSQLVRYAYKHLAAQNLANGPLEYTDLIPFDQHHYNGTDAVDDVIRQCHIGKGSRVVNIGSGLGGPARYMAAKVGASVTACELLPELHRAAVEFTTRCGLSDSVTHVEGDFMVTSQNLSRASADAIVSWLTVLHFSDRRALFKHCYNVLKPGGYFFAADFYQRSLLTKKERQILEESVGCRSLASSFLEYQSELHDAGFKIIKAENMTDDWAKYTKQRVASFSADEIIAKIVGTEIHESMTHFYQQVADLYEQGNLGGIHVLVQKPASW